MGMPMELPEMVRVAIDKKIPTTLEQWFTEDVPLQTGQLMSRWLDDFQAIVEEQNCTAKVVEWAFLKWGETNMYDQVEQWLAPDHQLYVEQEFMEFAESSDVWWKMLEKTTIHNAGRDRYIPNVEIRIKEPDLHRQVRPREPICSAYGQDDTRQHELCDVEVIQVPAQKPPPVFRKANGDLVIYMLHLFSGRRRSGDIHFWIDEMAKEFLPDIQVVMISLDTAVHEECNLDNGPQWGYLLTLLAEGIFAGCATGPPCETWSAARHVQMEGPGHWPRPLRSASQPWGVVDLSCRELRQLHMGTRLYLHSTLLRLLWRWFLAQGTSPCSS